MQNKKLFRKTMLLLILIFFGVTHLGAYDDNPGPRVFVFKVPRPQKSFNSSDLCEFERYRSFRRQTDQHNFENVALSSLSGFLIGGLIGWGANTILKHVEKKKHPSLELAVEHLPQGEGEKLDYVIKRENRRKSRRRIATVVGTVCGVLASILLGGVFFNSSWSVNL